MQDPAPFFSLHKAFAPQGEGLHGFRVSSIAVTKRNVQWYSVDKWIVVIFYLECYYILQKGPQCIRLNTNILVYD